MSIIIPANSAAGGGFAVANSCRFNSASSDYLTKTYGSNGSLTTWTLSTWVKRSASGLDQRILSCDDNASGNQDDFIKFVPSDAFEIGFYNSGYVGHKVTSRLFRDTSAWYNIVCVWDTSNGTAADRLRVYVNGVRETSFSSSTNPSSSANSFINSTSFPLEIGRRGLNATQYIDGYLAETVFIDGQALAPTSFGEFDADSGIWKPINVSGLTFGTNGFYLDFENSGALGADVSGNTNNFTVNNLTAIDQSTDTCTNNFCTWNSLIPYVGGVSFEEGNLLYKNTQNTGSVQSSAPLTFGMTSGKWYAEFECDNRAGDYPHVGIAPTDLTADPMWGIGSSAIPMIAYGVDYNAVGNIHRLNSVIDSSVPSYTTGDVIGIALDLDNGRVYFSKNGTYVNSGNPSTGSNPYTFTKSDYEWTMGAGAYNGTIWKANLGSPPYAISSGNTDGDGYGNFEYAVPSGYFSLNTKNLAEYG